MIGLTNKVEDQIPQECECRQMKVDKVYALMSAILLKAAQKHIGLKAVGMVGRCWMMKEINDKLKEREEVCQSIGIHIKAYKSLNEEITRLTTELKQ